MPRKKAPEPNWRDPTPEDRRLPSSADEIAEIRRMLEANSTPRPKEYSPGIGGRIDQAIQWVRVHIFKRPKQ